MPLDETRQALLDVFCHCYEKLLDYLDALDDAAQCHPEWTAYRIIKECVDPATEVFGSSPPPSLDLSELCDDFLKRIVGAANLNLPSRSPVIEILDRYKTAVQASPVPAQVDLTRWQRLGEDLSGECYRPVLPADSPSLSRLVKPVCIEPWPSGKEFIMKSTPEKDGGESRIIFYFAPPRFLLKSYINLPFYFFHEYFSHIHTASLFAERDEDEIEKPFEDGWLLYLACDFYRYRLRDDPHPALAHHRHRAHYTDQYIQDQRDNTSKQTWVSRGYELADSFEGTVGKYLFQRISLLVATTPHDRFPDIHGGLHYDFVRRVKQWLAQVATRPFHEKAALLQLLAALLQDLDPLPRLFEFLIKS